MPVSYPYEWRPYRKVREVSLIVHQNHDTDAERLETIFWAGIGESKDGAGTKPAGLVASRGDGNLRATARKLSVAEKGNPWFSYPAQVSRYFDKKVSKDLFPADLGCSAPSLFR